MWFVWLIIGLLAGHYVIPDIKQLVKKSRVVYEIRGKENL